MNTDGAVGRRVSVGNYGYGPSITGTVIAVLDGVSSDIRPFFIVALDKILKTEDEHRSIVRYFCLAEVCTPLVTVKESLQLLVDCLGNTRCAERTGGRLCAGCDRVAEARVALNAT